MEPMRAPVIALHCSGAGAGAWKPLGDALGPAFDLLAPEHFGCDSAGPWTGEHAFTLADEAARSITLIDHTSAKAHLIGHSYGGGVALRVALARPERIASLTLYEPSAFHLLKTIDDSGTAAADIAGIARDAAESVISGDYRGGARRFVDYWGGVGAWDSLRPSVQAFLVRWMPKAPLDFAALIDDQTPCAAYARLGMPALIMRGEHAPRPSRLIAEALVDLLPNARLAVVPSAGHMGPMTHATAVAGIIVSHIVASASRVVPRLGFTDAARTGR